MPSSTRNPISVVSDKLKKTYEEQKRKIFWMNVKADYVKETDDAIEAAVKLKEQEYIKMYGRMPKDKDEREKLIAQCTDQIKDKVLEPIELKYGKLYGDRQHLENFSEAFKFEELLKEEFKLLRDSIRPLTKEMKAMFDGVHEDIPHKDYAVANLNKVKRKFFQFNSWVRDHGHVAGIKKISADYHKELPFAYLRPKKSKYSLDTYYHAAIEEPLDLIVNNLDSIGHFLNQITEATKLIDDRRGIQFSPNYLKRKEALDQSIVKNLAAISRCTKIYLSVILKEQNMAKCWLRK